MLSLAGRALANMAQSKVNDYFTNKKKNSNTQAAKRRKIEIPFTSLDSARSLRSRSRSDDGKKSPATNPLIPSDSESELERDSVSFPRMVFPTESSDSLSKEAITLSHATLETKKKQNPKKSSDAKAKKKTMKVDIRQRKLTNVGLIKKSPVLDGKVHEDDHSVEDEDSNSDGPTLTVKTQDEAIVSEEITSVWDDKLDCSTPRKRIIKDSELLTEGSLPRKRKVPVRKLTPEKASTVNKKLDLPSDIPGPSKAEDDKEEETDKEVDHLLCGKSQLLALVAEVLASPEHAVSPLPTTPERQRETTPSPETVAMTPKLQNLTQKLKALSKMNGQALKNRLKQSGKLSAVKEKLGELEEAAEVTQEVEKASDDSPQTEEKILPAYQRFEHLVEEGTPTLTLPYSYRILEGAFQAMDTVVSMMHNRCEMCTFSKLRNAVQNMTKKNFEEKTVGQIKTVVPNAYTFRQEKNIPSFGKKSSGYQLTVEANLEEDQSTSSQGDGPALSNGDGKPSFTASCLLRRKKHFKRNLVDCVKQHHKKFLASLVPPISVPDHKLTRWHPKFPLDKVPEVEPALLPQPPEIHVYHSAKDVLEKQKGRLNPRVEAALSKIVSEKKNTGEASTESSQSSHLTPASSTSSLQSSSSSSSQNSESSPMKGIPPALLAKIRAKEAQKMQDALTRSPAEDLKTKMMGHLPDIMRILRTYFVTEKKPALPIDSVYKKLGDSFRIGMSQADMEQHINLLMEMAPEFISMVEIKRGKFLKLDKNVDVQAISSRIMNIVKSRK